MKLRTGNRGYHGFSLVEVMCATLILGVALVGLTHGLTTALASSKDSEMQTAAALFAAGQIEQIRADDDFSDGETDGDCGESLPFYRWKQSIQPADVAGLHEIHVTISKARNGESIYELTTLLFDNNYPSQEDKAAQRGGNNKKGAKRRDRRAP